MIRALKKVSAVFISGSLVATMELMAHTGLALARAWTQSHNTAVAKKMLTA